MIYCLNFIPKSFHIFKFNVQNLCNFRNFGQRMGFSIIVAAQKIGKKVVLIDAKVELQFCVMVCKTRKRFNKLLHVGIKPEKKLTNV